MKSKKIGQMICVASITLTGLIGCALWTEAQTSDAMTDGQALDAMTDEQIVDALADLEASSISPDTSIQINQLDKATTGQGSNSCSGVYYAYAKMTNSTGGLWLTPPAGTTSGIFTDASGFPLPYSSVVQVTRRNDGTTWCEATSVTFPATNTTSYQLIVYVTSPTPPPTNGQPMTLEIQWQ